ncbi:MAG TPA: glycosyltransferase family 4 protein [Anaerolineales bacterium]|nr:glycosyltransferase family 4 protein [Anaerolineales bacterium]
MHYLIVQETDWLKRGPHQQHHLFERLNQRGHSVTVLDFEIQYTPFPKAPLLAKRTVWQAVARVLPHTTIQVVRPATLRLPVIARLLSLPSFYLELRRQVRENRPDVLVNYALSTGLPALWVAREYHIPFLMHVIDALPQLIPNRVVLPIAQWFESHLLHQADSTVYINHELAQYGIAHGAYVDSAHTIRTGVDLQRFAPLERDVQLAERWGIATEDTVLLFTGWLYHFAGLDKIIRQLPELPAHVKVLIVGDGDAFEALQALTRELGLQGRVIFAGRQPYADMPAYLSLAQVCLMYSEVNDVMRHIVPIKTYEYLSAGKVVLASELPGVMQDIPAGNGVVYANDETLHATLITLLNKQTSQEHGLAGRAFVNAHCDWEKLTTEFEQLLTGGRVADE